MKRARETYLRTLTAPGDWTVPGELAATLALVPELCRELEKRESEGLDANTAPKDSGTPRVKGEGDARRDRIVRAVDHELRNRLNGPRLHARLLESTLEEPESRRLSRLLSSGLESAAAVVDDVSFLLSPARGGEVPVRELIVAVVDQHVERAKERQVTLEVVEPLSTALVSRRGLRLVLENLVANAIEHHEGGPFAAVRISTQREGDRLRVCVEDNGPGLPHQAEERLRGGTRDTKADHGRNGLGLVIVARAVRSLGARLDVVRPESGRGTRIVLDLEPRGG